MLEIKFVLSYFIIGFLIAFLYEIIRFFKKTTKSFVFLHILIDFMFFYFISCFIFIKSNLIILETGIFYIFVFICTGFLFESVTSHFLIDKAFQFGYTKFTNIVSSFKNTRLGKKIFK